MKCDSCGLESTLEKAFRPVRRLFLSPLSYCPSCWLKRAARHEKRALVACLVMGIVGIAIALGMPEFPDRWFLLGGFLLVAFQIVCIVPHELGHALAAELLGMRVFRLSFGSFGRVLYEGHLLGWQIEIRSVPLGGFTRAVPRSMSWVRLRWSLFILAGPCVNGLLILAVLLIPTGSSVMRWLAALLLYGNAAILTINLFPWRLTNARGSIPSDGKALLAAAFGPVAGLQEKHALYFVLEAEEALLGKKYAAAQRWCEEGLREYPDNTAIQTALAVALLGLGHLEEARRAFLELSDKSQEEEGVKAILLNNVAWVDLMLEEPGLLGEADGFSKRAFELIPWVSAVKSTRGSVLVELGPVDEGLGLLKLALADQVAATNRATIASWIAIGLKKKGQIEESRQYLAEAQRLDPDCPMVVRALRELECQGVAEGRREPRTS